MKYTQNFKYVISSVISAIIAISTVSITQIQAKSAKEVTTEIDISATDYLLGDVNVDGEFNVLDVVVLQKWLHGKSNLDCWQNADFTDDGIINIFDLCLMKNNLINNTNSKYIDEFIPYEYLDSDVFVTYVVEVTIKQQYTTNPRRVWTMEDFKGIDNITEIMDNTLPEDYRQKLWIFIEDVSEKSVLETIHNIENLGIEEIYMVRPTNWGNNG
ncbi:MAG: dockerin type I repeat-containing protein, partial [Oscillospiraceae bacterium]|nr:dockerin type I repeat-containing protein [Oscillospiraceae bacterium]